jgi:GT2 family glycosyltransferase
MDNCGCIGVVTVTYNSANVLPDFIRCLTAQRLSKFTLYVVDNASSDATMQLLENCRDPRVRVIANRQNRGVAEGNNQGIQCALEDGCEAILLLNNDTEFDEHLIMRLAEGLVEHDADMTCPKIMYFDNPEQIWCAGGAFELWRDCGANHIGYDEIDRKQYDHVRRVSYVPTCCVLIRKEVFRKVGLMDARYFVYMDDVDFMYRAWKLNVKLVYLPNTRLLHKVGGLTGGEESPFSIRYDTRNQVFFHFKHFGLLRSIPWLLHCQLRYVAKLAVGKKSWRWFRLKETAFLEGLKLLPKLRK